MLPKKKSEVQVLAYKKYGPRFGNLLFELIQPYKKGKDLFDLYQDYIDLCEGYFAEEEYSFPFEAQTNTRNEIYGFPLCVSIGSKIAHGRVEKETFTDELISVDCGLKLILDHKTCIHLDAAVTIAQKKGKKWEQGPLLALKEIIKQQPKNTKQVSKIINETAQKVKSQQIVSLTGHGIGTELHEHPLIYNAPGPFIPIPLFNGFCFCAEPIFLTPQKGEENNSCIGSAYLLDDNWTVVSAEGKQSSHFETTFLVEESRIIDVVGITTKKW